MATGYTADVKDGKISDFRVFAMRCARAFGALVEMRDDSLDAPIPEAFEPSTYHTNALATARAALARLQRMTVIQANRAAEKAHAEAMREWERAQRTREIERTRYAAMLAKVRAWQPPSSDHVPLKKFMVEQLEESIRFDCGDVSEWKPKPLNGAAWLAKEIERAQSDVAYHEEHLAEDIKRAAERTRWVQQLRDSLTHNPSPVTR